MGWWDRLRQRLSRNKPDTANLPATVDGPSGTTADGVAIDFRLGAGPPRPSVSRRGGEPDGDLPSRELPESATIAAFSFASATGFLAMADEQRLRFGSSACKGFEPVPGARVIVDAIGRHPLGGLRATSIRRDLTDRNYDTLLAERDAALGLPPRPSDERSAAMAAELAQIIVLLDEPLSGPGALSALLAALPAPAPEFTVDGRGSSITAPGRLGRHPLEVFFGASPFPRTALDLRGVAAGFDLGRGFLGIAYDAFGLGAQLRAATGIGVPSVWGPTGGMRAVAHLALSLRPHTRGIVLPGAGMQVRAADEFARLTGDLDDPDHVPAWYTLGAEPGDDNGDHEN